ncbi:NAD(P)H-dependent oxidoreductase [Vibrio sp. Isolate25]|uniref:NADPH-dependent FMN reductase n=1 Tax=Vibrio sp. Isolate25 TaxID=2908535 RepID=UPI001EFD2590|nr:NAD(P)H-dependent oxidoreductase [Vibrio sp. Isolate25]MCG9596230.1 NAD(P)H-dependent oxidoreductase [Vibrio sp. Isolate25]
MKVLAFGASSSKHSINQKLAFYAAKQIEGADISLIDINDYEMPIFSEDREKELGSPQQAQQFFKAIGEADIVVISFAEHNGSYTAAYKNLFDWTSRINMKVFQNKPVVLLATSPGVGGASSVLNTAQGSAPYFAADVKGALSLPNFYDNFDIEEGVVTNQAFNQQLLAIVQAL